MQKIVLLTVNSVSTPVVYNFLSDYFNIESVIIESKVPLGLFLKKRIQRLGLMKVCGQILFSQIIIKYLTLSYVGRTNDIKKNNNLNDAPIDPQKIIRVSSVNSQDTISIFKKIDPQIVVVYGTRVIDKVVLASIPASFINIHAGITPQYRGVHGGYWALVQREPERCGVTIHLIDTGIDTGGILGQNLIIPQREDSFVTYPWLQLSAGLPILKNVLQDVLNNKHQIKKDFGGKSQIWTHPTFVEYLWHRICYGVR